MKPLYHLYVADYSPDGLMHISPELLRARKKEVLDIRDATPIRTENHSHLGHELNLIIHGNGRILTEREELSLSPGNVLIIPGGNRHSLVVEEHLCLYGIELYPHFLHELMLPPDLSPLLPQDKSGGSLPLQRTIDPSTFVSFYYLFEQCQEEYCNNRSGHESIMWSYGQLIVLFMLRALQTVQDPFPDIPTITRVLGVKSWMDRHLFEAVTLADLAVQAELSPSHFGEVFRKVVGISPMAYLTKNRLQHAANLLADTKLPISEIIYRVGFNDLSNFNHAFRKLTHLSPSDYRKKYTREQPQPRS